MAFAAGAVGNGGVCQGAVPGRVIVDEVATDEEGATAEDWVPVEEEPAWAARVAATEPDLTTKAVRVFCLVRLLR
jgi:hypothetical protein